MINKNNIVVSNLDDYNTLYKVDLNFDTKVDNISEDILSDYIIRVLSNYPYYINVSNIVDLIVDNNTNKITLIVSTKDTNETNDNMNVNSDGINYNSVNKGDIDKLTNSRIKHLNKYYPKRKYYMEVDNNKGKQIYEYDLPVLKNLKI